MADTVPAAEFARNFGRYKLLAQREAVPVSSNGTLAGYFVAPHEYEELHKLKEHAPALPDGGAVRRRSRTHRLGAHGRAPRPSQQTP